MAAGDGELVRELWRRAGSGCELARELWRRAGSGMRVGEGALAAGGRAVDGELVRELDE